MSTPKYIYTNRENGLLVECWTQSDGRYVTHISPIGDHQEYLEHRIYPPERADFARRRAIGIADGVEITE